MDYTQFVDPNIGTVGHLLTATAPLVQSPHGAALVAPVTRSGMKDRYLSDKIFGFSVGNQVVMPTVLPGKPDYEATASGYDHDLETARPHCYQVLLEDSNIEEMHTASRNYGMFSFRFPEEKGSVVIYVKAFDACTRVENSLYISGTVGFFENVKEQVRYDISGAEKVEEYDVLLPNGDAPDHPFRARAIVIRYAKSQAFLPFALSLVDQKHLDGCWEKQVSGKSFDDIAAECKAAWNQVLGKVRVEGGSDARKRSFYTALYRAMSRMHDYSVDGSYLGFDGKLHENEGHDFYCDDGIWDTFRGMHPLQLLLEPRVHEDTVASYLRMYQQSGWLPRFPFPGGNIPCMLGHHTVSILAESAVKGVPFDVELAFEAAKKNATQRTMLPWRDGEAGELTNCYYEKGFFPALDEGEKETCQRAHPFENRQAAAVTIEHSYDDWCVAQLARMLGKTEEEQVFLRRSKNYQKLWDDKIGFIHPRKMDGSFTSPYNPKFCGGQGGRMYFAENNAYIYNFAAQHDIPGTVAMMGGEKAFAQKLDNLFVEQYDGVLKSTFLYQYPDATGLMGQFCMGNEPSFHIPYLYNYCGQAWKTQRKLHEIIDLWFPDTPLGICGDEDGGAMSAFLAFSAMGFYPVNPASGDYDLGSPIFDKVELELPNGKVFRISAQGAAGKEKYIQSAVLNGKPLTAPKFSHTQLMEGGELVLTMGLRPNKELFC